MRFLGGAEPRPNMLRSTGNESDMAKSKKKNQMPRRLIRDLVFRYVDARASRLPAPLRVVPPSSENNSRQALFFFLAENAFVQYGTTESVSEWVSDNQALVIRFKRQIGEPCYWVNFSHTIRYPDYRPSQYEVLTKIISAKTCCQRLWPLRSTLVCIDCKTTLKLNAKGV